MLTLKPTLYTLIKALVGAETLIFADQNSPRPALPYWTMVLQTQRHMGTDQYSQGVTNDGDQTIRGTREATLALQRYGVDSDIKAAELRDKLQRTTVREQWQLQDIAAYDTGPVNNIPTRLDNAQYEPRASIDLMLRFGTRLLDRVGIIQTVEIENAFTGVESSEIVETVIATGNI